MTWRLVTRRSFHSSLITPSTNSTLDYLHKELRQKGPLKVIIYKFKGQYKNKIFDVVLRMWQKYSWLHHHPTRDSKRCVCLVINITVWKNFESLGSLGSRYCLKALDNLENHTTHFKNYQKK